MSDNQVQSGSEWLRRFTAINALIAIAGFFVTQPFIEPLRSGPLIESILFTLVLISGIMAVSDRWRNVWVALALALPTLCGRWVNHYRPDLMPPELFLIGGIFFVVFVIAHLLRSVLTASSVTTEVLCASLAAYLFLGLLWALGYWLVAELIPNAFAFSGGDKTLHGSNGLYFSFITLATVGYGDITPVAKVARMLAASEAMTGLLYVAVLIARLVSLQETPKSDAP
jgi:ion channel